MRSQETEAIPLLQIDVHFPKREIKAQDSKLKPK